MAKLILIFVMKIEGKKVKYFEQKSKKKKR